MFEFINLLMHPFIERATHHSTTLTLLAYNAIALVLSSLALFAGFAYSDQHSLSVIIAIAFLSYPVFRMLKRE